VIALLWSLLVPPLLAGIVAQRRVQAGPPDSGRWISAVRSGHRTSTAQE
jgi:hypothetical protein